MGVNKENISGWERRKARVRKKTKGTSERPRLNVYRSNKHIYAQIVSDGEGKTILSASTLSKALRGEIPGLKKTDAAGKLGEHIGKLAKEKGIDKIVFDRSGYLYHGRVKALAEGVRKSGINF